jgi:nucleotide-binding universal stress UspA family protein
MGERGIAADRPRTVASCHVFATLHISIRHVCDARAPRLPLPAHRARGNGGPHVPIAHHPPGWLARGCTGVAVSLVAPPDARVTLVGVVTPLLDLPATPAREAETIAQMERSRAFLWRDLDAHAVSLRAQGVRVVTTVRTGDVTEEIIGCAREMEADLILLTTHGASSLARWMLGSTAQRLLDAAMQPTLIVPARGQLAQARPPIECILLPLDGSPLAEAALPIAETLAARLDASIRVIRVAPNRGSSLQPAHAANDTIAVHRLGIALERACTEADRYIQSIVERLRGAGHDATGEVRMGDPAPTLSAFVSERPGALVVIATHGPSGGDWWTFGSVAEKLATTAPNPILTLRPLAGKVGRIRHDPTIAARYPD